MKYWVYMNGEVPGSYTPPELVALPGFSMTTLVCPAEGEILEKNWRRSGEFPDIIKVLHERDKNVPPSAPMAAQEAVMTTDVNALLDTASARLFSHVSDLMKELDNRREERALTVSVQRQVVELKDQLAQLRDKNTLLEGRMPRLSELEESARKNEDAIAGLEKALKAREEGMSELRMQLERARGDHDGAKRRLGESLNDLAIRNRLVDKLSRDLTEKELSLAKALGVIRRLEEDLNRIAPLAVAPVEAPKQEEPVVEAAKADETPHAPPPLPADVLPEQPAAQGALVKKFKKFISLDH
jgi:chromosome segregation ATPase